MIMKGSEERVVKIGNKEWVSGCLGKERELERKGMKAMGWNGEEKSSIELFDFKLIAPSFFLPFSLFFVLSLSLSRTGTMLSHCPSS